MEMPNLGQGSGPRENGRERRPKRRGQGRTRPLGMPTSCFSRPVTHHHDGKEFRIEIWSSSRKWCIRLKADRRCFYGATQHEAWTAFIQAIDPEAETVGRWARSTRSK